MTRSIDGFAFSRVRGVVRGQASAAQLPRIVESGVRDVRVEYEVRGVDTALGKPGLDVRVQGEAVLACQRCLEDLTHPIDLAVELELAAEQAAIDAAEDDIDRVLASSSMSVEQLVEDEVLLELPMAPRHPRCPSQPVAERAPTVLGSLFEGWRGRKDDSNG